MFSCGKAPPPTASSSGAFALVAVKTSGVGGTTSATPGLAPGTDQGDGTVLKMYLPVDQTLNAAGHAEVAVINAGLVPKAGGSAPAEITNALLKIIDLGVQSQADINAGYQAFATTSGGTAQMIVVASRYNPNLWFIDPLTDRVAGTASLFDLDPDAGMSSFSGGGGFVTGIAADPIRNLAILSVWNGFAVVDLPSMKLTRTIIAPPSENFGYDANTGRLYAPFYDCSDAADKNTVPPTFCGSYGSNGLNVIDVVGGKVYKYQDAKALDPQNPVGGEPDSAAIDTTNQILIVPAENDGYQNVIDFSNPGFDQAALTVTAGTHQRILNHGLTGVAIESNHHLAFWEEEGSGNIGFMKVSDAAAGALTFLEAGMPRLPNSTDWQNLGDPHGIAATTSVVGGEPVGIVVSADYQWVARLDLNTLAKVAPNQSAVVDPGAIESAVTFILVQVPSAN